MWLYQRGGLLTLFTELNRSHEKCEECGSSRTAFPLRTKFDEPHRSLVTFKVKKKNWPSFSLFSAFNLFCTHCEPLRTQFTEQFNTNFIPALKEVLLKETEKVIVSNLSYWLRQVFFFRAIFNWVVEIVHDCYGFAVLSFLIGRENSCQSLNRSNLGHSHFPAVEVVSSFQLLILIGSLWYFPLMLLS